jgi:hypothetical protein
MDVRGRRHGDDLAVEQLVARVGAVVERQELVESPDPPCQLSHAPSSVWPPQILDGPPYALEPTAKDRA